jgi:predicted heme/steroid binding protein/uncharacterized membrane protein
MKELDPETLSQYDGKDGKPAYIAYKDRVIDVSESPRWKGGTHMQRHQAGHELNTDIQAAPHGPEVLDRYPQVAVLKAATTPERPIPAFLSALLVRYPVLRRHPHPMTVHFPIVFMISTTVFSLLYVLTGYVPFEVTAFHCLGAGILMTPVAIITGLYAWWLNYMARPIRRVTIKRRLSFSLFVVAAVAFIWRLMVPDILSNLSGTGIVYLVLVLALTPFVLVIGWHGGQLTFPMEKE